MLRSSRLACLALFVAVGCSAGEIVHSDGDGEAAGVSSITGTLRAIGFSPKPDEPESVARHLLAPGQRTRYFLETDEGRFLELLLAARPVDAELDTRVVVDGDLLDGAIAVRMIAPSEEPSPSVAYAATTAPRQRKVAVVPVNFRNDTRQTHTLEQLREAYFTGAKSSDAYYGELSWGLLGWTGIQRDDGDVFGWTTIDYDNVNCDDDVFRWGDAAREKLKAQGVDLTTYEHVSYFFVRSDCGFGGMGSLPGKNTWINGYTGSVINHEFGHNLGLAHANSFQCSESGSRVPLATSCTSKEYGDPFDVMGSSSYQVSAFHKARLGLLAESNKRTVTATGDYPVTIAEANSTDVQSLRVARGNGTYLYVEARSPSGSFDTFSSTSAVASGILVRVGPDYTDRTQPNLIDTTPATTSYSDAALLVGQTLTDPVSGVKIRLVSRTSTAAQVHVDIPGDPSTGGGDDEPPPPPPPSGNLALGKPARASSSFGTNTPDKAFDGSTADASRWISNSTSGSAWLWVDLGASKSIARMELDAGGNALRTFVLQRWNGSAWVDISGTKTSGNSSLAVKKSFGAVTTQYVRLRITDDARVRVKELRVFAN